MKHIGFCFLFFMSGFTWGDTILGLHLGVGQWQGEVKGLTGEKDNATTLDDLGFSKENNNVFWANFEHGIPVLPNVRVMYTDISSESSATITQSFSLGGIVFDAEVKTQSELSLSHMDVTLYYELLDNWVEIDLGVTARIFDGYVSAASEFESTTSTLDGTLPMLYSAAKINLPFSGWFLGAMGHAIRFRGDGFHDYAFQLGYYYESLGMDFGFNLGYRDLYLDVAEFDQLYVETHRFRAFI